MGINEIYNKIEKMENKVYDLMESSTGDLLTYFTCKEILEDIAKIKENLNNLKISLDNNIKLWYN